MGGHVRYGEDYIDAAKREMNEELGLDIELEFKWKDYYTDERGIKRFLGTFIGHYDGPFRLNPREVEKIEYFSLEIIQQMIDSGDKFHPELLFILKKHFNIN